MLRLTKLKLRPAEELNRLKALCAKRLSIEEKEILKLEIVKKSIDARDKNDVHFVFTVDVALAHEAALLRHVKRDGIELAPHKPALPAYRHRFAHPPVVVGAGPAGLFAAYILAQNGANPLLIERGRDVEARTGDVEGFFAGKGLVKDSHVLFGEGGAGTFSDGKLNTGTKSPYHRLVLETFVACGAPEEILYLQKPHIGTDKLKAVVKALREKIKSLGGRVWFQTKLTGIQTKAASLCEITCQRAGESFLLPCDALILAIGHSARDTYQSLFNQGLNMAQKPFAVGVRIEHPQALINTAQYGRFAAEPALGAAEYKLNSPTPDGRGVFTFCMCPGGQVVAAADMPGGVVTNGMSVYARDGVNANAAVLVGVRPTDFMDDHPLSGLVFQRSLEQAAYRAGGGDFHAPCQRVEDFLRDVKTHAFGEVLPTYRPGVTPARLSECLPDFVTHNLKIGLMNMDMRLHGFAAPDAVLTGVETRTSSPVRILRDGTGQGNLTGIFPAGEGAGYAGGIMSASADGISAAVHAMERSLVY